MLCVMAAIFGYVFAQSLPALVASAVCNGFVLGIFQALASTYASDVAPIKLRHYVSSYINACWGIGILLSSGTVRGTLTIPGDLAWRLPFCLQWVSSSCPRPAFSAVAASPSRAVLTPSNPGLAYPPRHRRVLRSGVSLLAREAGTLRRCREVRRSAHRGLLYRGGDKRCALLPFRCLTLAFDTLPSSFSMPELHLRSCRRQHHRHDRTRASGARRVRPSPFLPSRVPL